MKKILITDDEKNIRISLKHALSKSYELDMAINGDEAIEKLENSSYDLLLLDINMPGKDGMEVLRILYDKNIKVNTIIMTAYGTIEKAVEAMKLGAVDFISKPFSPDEIKSSIEDILRRASLNEDELISLKDKVSFIKYSMTQGNHDKAMEVCRKTIGEYPEAAEPHNLIGILYEYQNDVQKAQMHYRAALAFDPSFTAAQNNLERTATRRFYSPVDMGDNNER